MILELHPGPECRVDDHGCSHDAFFDGKGGSPRPVLRDLQVDEVLVVHAAAVRLTPERDREQPLGRVVDRIEVLPVSVDPTQQARLGEDPRERVPALVAGKTRHGAGDVGVLPALGAAGKVAAFPTAAGECLPVVLPPVEHLEQHQCEDQPHGDEHVVRAAAEEDDQGHAGTEADRALQGELEHTRGLLLEPTPVLDPAAHCLPPMMSSMSFMASRAARPAP
jgi:hypothetical protein